MERMKRIFLLFTIVEFVLATTSLAQICTVTFTGEDRTGQYHIPLSRVVIFNHSQMWEEFLFYPDTVLTMGGVGVANYDTAGQLRLMQNVPNPFEGTTFFSLLLSKDNEVLLEIYDMNGRTVAKKDFSVLPAGTHLFQATLSSPQTYLLNASVENGKAIIKLVNEGYGGENAIHYMGMTDNDGNWSAPLKDGLYDGAYPFRMGDEMQYTGYAVIGGVERTSNTIICNQTASETIPFLFDVTAPSVTTLPVTPSSITTTSATCNGNVTDLGGLSVQYKGFCWSTSQNPTLDNDHNTMGGGSLGNFSSTITGLSPAITYYVRAYATNEVGTAYGQQQSFVTNASKPTISTLNVTDITNSSATCGGDVSSDGGATVTARGVCWSTSPNPTVNDNITTNGTGVGTFTSNLTGLSSNITYYVRAYASNSAGTSYGEQVSFTTPDLPMIATNGVTGIAHSTAVCGGYVYTNGGSSVIARGVCWSTQPNPTINNTHTSDGTGLGLFTSSLTGLNANTIYYVRAYATTSIGTAYGQQVAFTTTVPDGSPCVGNATLTDFDGNVYNTVKIGNQCWMKENLRTTHYADGTSIALGVHTDTSTVIPYRCYPGDDVTNVPIYGYLYNWPAVMHGAESSDAIPSGVQGICPVGWHVPSKAEWTCLTDYLGSQNQYVCGTNPNNVAKALASTVGWYSDTNNCAVGNILLDNNASGFSALPAGTVVYYASCLVGIWAQFWTSSSWGCCHAGSASFSRSSLSVLHSNGDKFYNLSVRCLRDEAIITTDGQPCPGAETILDYDGNQYNTVQIGSQCWMKENVRSTHYADGRQIPLGADTSSVVAYRYCPNNNSDNVPTCGYLYNWPAVMDGASSSSANPSGVQGVCPSGWHMPSAEEWVQLLSYVSSQSQYVCGNASIAKALASETGWNSSNITCAPGNNQNSNNATGFSIRPAGFFASVNYNYEFGYSARVWSARGTGTGAGILSIYSNGLGASSPLYNGIYISAGCAVRCLRD